MGLAVLQYGERVIPASHVHLSISLPSQHRRHCPQPRGPCCRPPASDGALEPSTEHRRRVTRARPGPLVGSVRHGTVTGTRGDGAGQPVPALASAGFPSAGGSKPHDSPAGQVPLSRPSRRPRPRPAVGLSSPQPGRSAPQARGGGGWEGGFPNVRASWRVSVELGQESLEGEGWAQRLGKPRGPRPGVRPRVLQRAAVACPTHISTVGPGLPGGQWALLLRGPLPQQ